MPFNELLGAGAEPRYARNIEKFEISQSLGLSASGSPPADATAEIAINPVYGEGRLFAVSITVAPINANGTTGQATRPTLAVFIKDALIVRYSLSPECSDAKDWHINEIVPYNYDIYGGGNVLRVVLSAAATGGNGYGINVSIAAHTVPTV